MKKQILFGTLLLTAISGMSLPVIADEAAQRRIIRPGDDRGDRGDRPGRPGRPDEGRPDRPGRPDYPDRPGRPGRPDYPGRPHRPGPGWPGPGRPDPRPPRPWPAPPMPVPDYKDSVFVSSVTRASGGEWFRVTFRNPVNLRRFYVSVVTAGVKIHETKVHTWSGRTIYLPEMTPSPVIYSPSTVGSSYFSSEAVRAIDIRAEGYGGYADLVIEAIGDYETPIMDVYRF